MSLDHIVIDDKTWVLHKPTETKHQWNDIIPGRQHNQKSTKTLSKQKVMATMFWDILLIDFTPVGQTIN